MPASTGQDGRVRTTVLSLQEEVEHLHFHDAPARSLSPCSELLTKQDSPQASPRRVQHQSLRPALNRSADSHLTTSSAKSAGTDGSSILQSEDGSLPNIGDDIDSATFEQILEMDDDEDEREFSKSIVYDFFTQAGNTFQEMDQALEAKDLTKLSQLGHFLKGSSATLGLTKVKDSCEKIQNFGARKDETGAREEPSDSVSLDKLKKTIHEAKDQFHQVEGALKRFYHDDGTT